MLVRYYIMKMNSYVELLKLEKDKMRCELYSNAIWYIKASSL